MKRNEILNVFRMLVQSQGLYGRLLRDLNENPEWGDEFLSKLEEMNFKDSVDLILAIEG